MRSLIGRGEWLVAAGERVAEPLVARRGVRRQVAVRSALTSLCFRSGFFEYFAERFEPGAARDVDERVPDAEREPDRPVDQSDGNEHGESGIEDEMLDRGRLEGGAVHG